jgi:hypothetical protein
MAATSAAAMQAWRRVEGADLSSELAAAVSLSIAERHSTSQTTIQMTSQRKSGSVMAVVCR